MDSCGWSSGCSGSLSLICSSSKLLGDFWQGGRLRASRWSVSITGGVGSSQGGGDGDGGGSSCSESSVVGGMSIFGSSSWGSISGSNSGSASGSGSVSGSNSGSVSGSGSGSGSGSAGIIGGSGSGDGSAIGDGVDSWRDSSSFFRGVESGDPGEQRSMVRDLSSVSLELATIPLSLLLPQSRLRGLRAGGDLLSMARGESTGDCTVVTGCGAGVGRGGEGLQDAGASAGGCESFKLGFGFSLMGVVDVALVATEADSTSFGTGADGGTSFGGFDMTGVIEIEGLFSCTGTSLGGSVLEIGLIGGGGLVDVVLVAEAMIIFWLFRVFMMGLEVVVKVGTVATSGGGDRGCEIVVDPEGRVDVDIVMGDVKEDEDGLLLRTGFCGFRNRFEEIGTNCGV